MTNRPAGSIVELDEAVPETNHRLIAPEEVLLEPVGAIGSLGVQSPFPPSCNFP